MSFARDIALFSEKVERRGKDIVVEMGTEMHRSITHGSAVTGAPGQPVDTGNLLNSWQLSFPSDFEAETVTNTEYAQAIEDGIGITFRSSVGGFHSVKMTRAANQKMADAAAEAVVG